MRVISLHAWLALVLGILITFGAVLAVAAASGAAYYGLAVSAEIAIAVLLFFVALILSLIFYFGVKAQFRKVETGKEALIGSAGVATSNIDPKGEVRVNGEFWQATTKNEAIAAGQAITVVAMDGMFLVVQPAESKA